MSRGAVADEGGRIRQSKALLKITMVRGRREEDGSARSGDQGALPCWCMADDRRLLKSNHPLILLEMLEQATLISSTS
eukprot:765830-Hanusia_phi.AAC.10